MTPVNPSPNPVPLGTFTILSPEVSGLHDTETMVGVIVSREWDNDANFISG